MNSGHEDGRLAAFIFGAALVAVAFAWWMSLAPRPLPGIGPADAFSAYRAIEHVRQMAVEPHPGGSHANEKVYEYIAGQLQAMGVEMVVERPIMLRDGRTVERNGAILARLPGTASTGAFAVDAHFDSTPYGPGAADDVSGIAAMLETIRALKAGKPLKNDVLFCFADKEEMGGDGGPGVFIRHPWFKDVRAILGLETRGTSGPALMFETGPDNGFLIRQLAQSEAHPRATSIMFDFYNRMPFGSDFDKYKRLDLPGLNVAYIDDFAQYHTKLDAPENLDLASLQHHGSYTLGLSRRLGEVSLENCRAPNVIYFNTVGSHMVVYPYSWGTPIAWAAGLFFLVVLLFGFARRQLTISGVLAGVGIYFSAAVLSFIVTVPLAALVYFKFHEHALYRNDSLSMAQLLMGVGILLLFARLARNRVRPQNLLAGVLVWWTVVLGILLYIAPYGSYAAAWPLMFISISLFVLCLSPRERTPSNLQIAIASLAVLPAIMLLVPSFVVMSYAVTALLVPVLLLLVLLMTATLLPQMSLLPARIHSGTGVVMVISGILLFALACLTNTPSPDRPRQNCLSYAVNFDTGEAWWISGDKKLDEWTRNFFPEDGQYVALAEFLGYDNGPRYRRAAAPMPPFGKTVLTVLGDRIENGHRILKLFIDSPRDAQEIHLRMDPDVPVYRAKALGIEIEGAEKGWDLVLDTIPFEGGDLEIETDPGKPLRFHLRETSYGLPDIPGLQPRPPHMMTQPNRVLERRYMLPSNHIYSLCTYTF